MFEIGATVVYGHSGVCRVADRREETFGPVRQEYYVLQPVRDPRSTFYCPVKGADGRLRPLLTEEELRRLIANMPATQPLEEGGREDLQAMLKSGDHGQLVCLIRTLYAQRQAREAKGRHLHQVDERLFNEAKRLLHEEVATVLAIPPEEVEGYIQKALEAG